MPPPNANGRLHAGHGLDMTLKDIAARFQRMRGKRVLFLPGADHAGFETQMVFEKKWPKKVDRVLEWQKINFIKKFGILRWQTAQLWKMIFVG